MSPISKGSRVRMSKLGAVRCPRIADKHGIVVGGGYYNTVIRVLFDNSRSPVSLHRDYLEKVPAGSERSGVGGIECAALSEATSRVVVGVGASISDTPCGSVTGRLVP
jgi:hypothetical protein